LREKDGKQPIRLNGEYHTRVDKRRRAKQRLLTAPHVESNNYDPFGPHEKVHQVQFKISPFATKVGEEAAALFNLSLSQYCKALLYLNLGLVSEPLDRRRRRFRSTK
jgi:hypothetical protein